MALINPFTFQRKYRRCIHILQNSIWRRVRKDYSLQGHIKPEFPVTENDANRIMHIDLPIGKSNVLMASDVLERLGKVRENDNRFKIAISAEAVKKPTNYLKDFQKAEILKCLLPTTRVDTLECLQTNLVLNGWWTLTQIIRVISNGRKTTKA